MSPLKTAIAITIALAAPINAAEISTGATWTSPPVGFQIFCLANAAACTGGGASTVTLTEAKLTTLQAVNNAVNRSIRPATDRNGDIWQLNVTSGDCEDYVLAKREALASAGFPRSSLRIAAVMTPSGVPHAILVVRTSQGDLVLDNLTSKIKPADEAGMFWVAMTKADGRTWALTGQP